MSSDSVTTDGPPADEADTSCIPQFIERAPTSTTSGLRHSACVKTDNLLHITETFPDMKQVNDEDYDDDDDDHDDVCAALTITLHI